MIELVEVKKCFDNKLVIQDINYKFVEGRIYLLTGGMGVGKSTLIKIIVGIDNPTNGMIISDYKSKVFVYNEAWNYIYEDVTVSANLKLYKSLFHPSETHYKKIIQLFELDNILRMKVSKLSTGNKKKVSLACSFLNEDPKVIVLDEPLINLDIKLINQITKYLENIKSKKIIIIVSHQFTEIKDIIDIRLELTHNSLVQFEC